MDVNTIALCFKGIANIIESSYVLINEPDNGVKHPNSHTNKRTGNSKIPYSKSSANSEAVKRTLQTREVHVPYKCDKCENFHIGHRNKVGPSSVLIFSTFAGLIQTGINIFDFKGQTIIPYY